MSFTSDAQANTAARRAWMGLLARAPARRLGALLPRDLPDHTILRPAEIGGVMVQGRTGAVGAPFNLGEMTVTRCALRLATGEVGYGHVQGRDRQHAIHAALVDAMLQGPQSAEIDRTVLEPLRIEETARRAARAGRAAATKVEFFTLVRGEDQ